MEDEVHFIFDYPLYYNLRYEFFNYICRFHNVENMSNCDNLNVFMTDTKVINRFANFIRNYLPHGSLVPCNGFNICILLYILHITCISGDTEIND